MAQLIEKPEKVMSKEEKLELEIMRTLAAGKGHNLRDASKTLKLCKGSTAMAMADALMKRFKIDFKDEKEYNLFWPSKDLNYIRVSSEVDEDNMPIENSPKNSKPASPPPTTDNDKAVIEKELEKDIESEEKPQAPSEPPSENPENLLDFGDPRKIEDEKDDF